MASLPYMQFYPGDYLADTAHLTTLQHGAYLLLIINYWQRGKALNNSNDRLTTVVRMSNEQWNENKNTLREFFEVVGDEWYHKRIEADLEAIKSKSEQAREAGKASAAKRYNNSNGRSTSVQHPFNHKIRQDKTRQDNSITRETCVQRVIPPSFDEVKGYCNSRQNSVNPDRFMAHYESNGWMVGKNKMKDWQAAIRTWEKNELNNSKPSMTNIKNQDYTKIGEFRTAEDVLKNGI